MKQGIVDKKITKLKKNVETINDAKTKAINYLKVKNMKKQ